MGPINTQKYRAIAIGTPLDDDVLLLKKAVIREKIGLPFHVTLDLLSEQQDIVSRDLVGHNATIRLELLNGRTRYINGFISRFRNSRSIKHGEFFCYDAVMVPWLWFLTRTANCRIFQNMTIPDIIKQVFRDHGFTDFKEKITGSYPQQTYCVQYRETDYNFVQRLMEAHGIYYYFEHENGVHHLVLMDDNAMHAPFEGFKEISYLPYSNASVEDEHIRTWSAVTSVQPGTVTLQDFDFSAPLKNLTTKQTLPKDHPAGDFEIYDYPGKYVEDDIGKGFAGIQAEAYTTRHQVMQGESDCRGLAAGYTFDLRDHPVKEVCKTYLVTACRHVLNSAAFNTGEDSPPLYTCSLEAVDVRQQFRMQRLTPGPLINGPQTAMVVGPSGDEIHTDEYGRVKVQFHWDREGKVDENSSCWIRVAQIWAGKKWGAMYIPRIGQEVIVEFLEGDPDRPIITGRVYNGQSMPPYSLPDEKTKSTLKSNSSKDGDGFNEIRFEDKTDDEQFFMHAQKNMDVRVLNDSFETILGSRHQIIGSKDSGSRKERIHGDKHFQVDGQRLGKISGDDHLTVEGARIQTVKKDDHYKIDGNRMQALTGDDNRTVTGSVYDKVDGDAHLDIAGDHKQKTGGSLSITTGMNMQNRAGMKYALDAGTEVHIKSGAKVIIEAGAQVSLVGPGGFIDIGPSGVSISGTVVNINSGGSAGSGSGASPASPDAPAPPNDPSPPENPEEADTADKGDLSEKKDAPEPRTNTTISESNEVPEAVVKKKDAEENAENNKTVCQGDPVNAVTGTVVGEVTDFTLNTRIPLVWERHYSSRNTASGHLGIGWQCPADITLKTDRHGMVTCDFADKSAAVFSRLPGDRETISDVKHDYFLSQTETHYLVSSKSLTTFRFPRTDSPCHVDRITDANGNYLTFKRDDQGLYEISDNTDLCIKVDSENNRIHKMTRILPDKTEVRLAAYQYHPDTHDLIAAYDKSDQPRTYAYKNHCMVRHTLKNNLSFYYEYDNNRCVHTWGDNGLYDYTFDYHPDERFTRVTNSLGYTQTIQYNQAFRHIAIIDHDNHETRYTYDAENRPLSVTDPLNRTTAYAYDPDGNLTTVTRPDNTVINITCDRNGNPLTIMDPNGHAWLQEFDDRSRLIRKVSPTGAETRYSYNDQGDLLEVTAPNGGRTVFEYTPAGRIIAVTHADDTQEQFERDAFGNIITAVDPLGRKTRYTYDDAFRLTTIIKPTGDTIHCTYTADDRLTAYTDEAGHRTEFSYFGTGHIRKKINPDNTEITYTYDTEEQLTQLTNERGENYLFSRDYSGRIISETDFHGHATHYEYDAAGQLIRHTDALERHIDYTFDPLGRLTAKQMSDGLSETFDYDPNGNLIAAENTTAVLTREYDPDNRMIAETSKTAQTTHTTTFWYDNMGNRTQRISPFGNTVQYEYDLLGRNTAIRINRKKMEITRNPLGLPVRETFDNGLNRSYDYTSDNRLSLQAITLPQGRTINRTYEYDPVGNLTARQDADKGKQYFTYNPMGRITRYTDPENKIMEFLHGPAGDLLQKTGPQESGHRHMTFDGTDYEFDAAGNLVSRNGENGHYTFDWDINNILTEAVNQDTGKKTGMTYDALGRRISKTTGNQTTAFTWDGDHLLSDTPNGTGEREFVYYPGTFEPLAVIDKNRNILYVHNDSVGLPREITDNAGTLVWSAQFDAQGNIEKVYANEFDNPLRFQGQYYDPEIDLSYNRHRYFDCRIGSFISQDPLGLVAGTNVYAYAPNVWGWVDPLGLCANNLPMNHPFSEGGTHITTTTGLDRFPSSPTFGGPDGLFIAPTPQIDDLIKKSTSRADIEMALGLPKGQLGSGDLVRVDVLNPFDRNLRLPTSGNDFFRPGVGLTTGNLNEGIIASPLKTDTSIIKSKINGL